MAYWVYIPQSEASGQYYIGSTGDLQDRIAQHHAGRVTATRARGPWRFVYAAECATRQAAVVRERQIKAQKSRAYVERLVRAARVG